MARYRLHVNGERREVDLPADTPLLWALRERLGLLGPKYGCGVGACCACTSLVDGRAARPCVTTVAESQGSRITTIEGLSEDGDHPVQRAWLELYRSLVRDAAALDPATVPVTLTPRDQWRLLGRTRAGRVDAWTRRRS